jgi:hypothetical protein
MESIESEEIVALMSTKTNLEKLGFFWILINYAGI